MRQCSIFAIWKRCTISFIFENSSQIHMNIGQIDPISKSIKKNKMQFLVNIWTYFCMHAATASPSPSFLGSSKTSGSSPSPALTSLSLQCTTSDQADAYFKCNAKQFDAGVYSTYCCPNDDGNSTGCVPKVIGTACGYSFKATGINLSGNTYTYDASTGYSICCTGSGVRRCILHRWMGFDGVGRCNLQHVRHLVKSAQGWIENTSSRQWLYIVGKVLPPGYLCAC